MSSDRRPWYRRRIVIFTGVALLALAGAAAVFALTRPGDVYDPEVAFRPEPTSTPVEPPQPPPPARKRKKPRDPLAGFQWAQYGYSKDRRRYLPTRGGVRPPFKQRWAWDGHVLLEFPPIIVGDRLFTTTNDGRVVALDRRTGKVVWKRDMGYLAASSPAYGDKKIYVTILERTRNVRAGRVTALRARDGKFVWSRPLASRTESSPVYDDGRVYFGSENGTVYAMRAHDGSVSWRFRASGAVKGGLAVADGKLYFGAYGGSVYALWQLTGRVAWSTGTSGANFGLSAGNFYATPAVGFGRVYIGNTDGNMYSFSSESGKLAWRRGTGSYVYSSAALAQVPGGEPTVYFGSYDGTFYALDARTGATRWTHDDGGKISGGASVVGDVVYFSNWGKRDTTGLGARTGRRVWHSDSGAYNPVISDGRDVYLTGFQKVMALTPQSAATPAKKRGAKRRDADRRREGTEKRRRAERSAKRRRQGERRRERAAQRRQGERRRERAAKRRREERRRNREN
jgi:outer membrane protein assembly factor BamB